MRNKNMFILKYLKLTGDYILNSVVKLWMQILSRMEKFNKCPQSYNVLSQFWLHGVVFLEKMIIGMNVRHQFYNENSGEESDSI